MNSFHTILIFCFVYCMSVTARLNAQNVTIPDSIFKAYLLNVPTINTNGDGEIQFSEAVPFSGTINCNNRSISDLTGIQAFVNLRVLYCQFNQLSSLDLTQNTSLINLLCNFNQLSSLDLSQNTSLIDLVCNYNQLSSLDVTQNTSLATLYCGNNPLSSIDVTQNTSLKTLSCSANQLSSLDVTQNTSLVTLYCAGNQLSSLDVAQNTSLATLYCSGNPLSSINVTQNTSLKTLYCNSNQLSNLDVTQNTGLRTLHCSSNQLSSLDMTQNTSLRTLFCMNNQLTNLDLTQNTNLIELICQNNQLTSLDVKNGNNTSMTGFVSNNNSSLTCIQVDDSNYSTAYWINVDSTATFSTNCSVFNSINTMNQAINLTAYPNPTTKNITLDLGKDYQEANIQITNLTGQVILNKSLQNSSTTTLELEGAVGIYFVNIQTEEGTAILKIIRE